MRVQLKFPDGMSQRDQRIIFHEVRKHLEAKPPRNELEANRRAQAFVKERYGVETTFRIQRTAPQRPGERKIDLKLNFQGNIPDAEKAVLLSGLQAHFALHPPTSDLEAQLRMQAFMDGYNTRQKFES